MVRLAYVRSAAMPDDAGVGSLPPEFFRRQDERPDALFFAQGRVGSHLDGPAIAALRGWYEALLPRSGPILDLCAGLSSHLPSGSGPVVGVGSNELGMASNEGLQERWAIDLNGDAPLPWPDATFAAAVCTASVQYLVRPRERFREVARCLRPGAPFLVAFGNRMFPTKAVLCWRVSDDAAHGRLVESYFQAAGFGPTFQRSFLPDGGDPLYLIGATAP
jgi:SAM-dependent methyltransferase